VFSWPLEHQQAGVVVEALQGLLAGAPAAAARPATVLPAPTEEGAEPDQGAQDAADGAAQDPARNLPALPPPALAADTNRNAVVFRGPAREWQRLSAQIHAMDVPSPSVLVEVLLVDVRLDRNAGSGLEWLASGSIHGDEVSFGSSGLGLGQDGFNLLLRDGSTVRAALALFAADTRAAIRARPRLVVASGHEARLEVGDEIPVVASSSRSARRPDAPLVSAVEYRHTGLSLAVRPTVLAGDRVELEVLQELSSARETASSGIDSPTIRSRRLQTTVSLRDGGAVLLGGLQETAGSASRAGAAALPGPATALDAKTRESGRTELMVLIRPRVLRSPEEAAALTAGGR
jgi:general secretion pathway protein D